MKLPNPFQSILLFSILLCLPERSFSQCASRFEIKQGKKDTKTCQVEVKVFTSSTYKGAISVIEGTHERIVKTFSGRADSNHLVDIKMESETLYRIAISFDAERDFLCKHKIKIIDLTDNH